MGWGGVGERSDAAGNWKHDCSRGRERRDGEGKERGADVHRCSGGEDSGGNAALARKVLLVDAVLRLVDAGPPPPPVYEHLCSKSVTATAVKPPPLHYPTPPSDSAT